MSSTRSVMMSDYDDDEETGVDAPLLDEKPKGGIERGIKVSDWTPPDQRFVSNFPLSWEKRLQKFDDVLIRIFQRPQSRFLILLDLAITGIFAIETGIAAPFILFAIGWDGAATALAYLILFLSLFSQIPKRFMWRYRPYMVKRAIQARTKESAISSSFPSRAVTCATSYSFVICYLYNSYVFEHGWDIQWWQPIFILFSIFSSSFARVNLGVHYPSDCVGGFLQGVIVCFLGTVLWDADTVGCGSCISNECYDDSASLFSRDFNTRNILTLIFFSLGSLLVTIFSVIKPIDFWQKCDRVYGTILPTIAFQVTLLCHKMKLYALNQPNQTPIYVYFYAVAVVALVSGAAYKNSARYPILSFIVQYVLLYSALVICRLFLL